MTRPSIRITATPADLAGLDRRYFHPGELDMLVSIIAFARPRTMIEFGCNEGRAAHAILHNIASIEQYVGIDVLPGYVPLRKCQHREVPQLPGRLVTDGRFRLMLRARGSFDLTAKDLPPCDAVFIDADHSRDGVLNDTALALAVLRPGGVVVWHDDNRSPLVQVSETLDELHGEGLQISHVEGTWLAFTRT